MLERQGMIMNHKRRYRPYREEGLSVRRRRGRKRARGSRTPMPLPRRPGERWSMDFVSDTFGASRKSRILEINDDCCRENLCPAAGPSISGARVARELDPLVRLLANPQLCRLPALVECREKRRICMCEKGGLKMIQKLLDESLRPLHMAVTGRERCFNGKNALVADIDGQQVPRGLKSGNTGCPR